MRKITFDERQIQEICEFATNHRFMEICNRFTIRPDVLRRLVREHDITYVTSNLPQNTTKDIPEDVIQQICDLYANTNLSVHDIRKQVNMRYDRVMSVIKSHFSAEYIAVRKQSKYAESKLGENNPMFGNFREAHPRYKGVVSDGK